MSRFHYLVLLIFAAVSVAGGSSEAAPPVAETAARIDRTLAAEIAGPVADSPSKVAERTSDEIFLRRVFFDLIGQPPTARDVMAFLIDESPDKRSRVVRQLLDDPAYGENWSRYWRDVIFYRRTEERSQRAIPALVEHLTERFNANAPWSEIARGFITATGDMVEDGETALIMAQGGKPEETVAEISRIFLGIQIQCAQCHDHPSDKWTREQFHELAAFFPRVAIRPRRGQGQQSFEVVVNDRTLFSARRNNNNRYRGTLEHRMRDLEDPEARGELMRPILFTSGQSLPMGTKDTERRGKLAEWITAKENPWFARAMVNRMWAELVGEGFYEPIDDLGPERSPQAAVTLELLANEFAESNYDVKWLLETICTTAAYQRVSRSVADPFTANKPQRLRGDQLFDAVWNSLRFPQRSFANRGGRGQGSAGGRGGLNAPRVRFNGLFGYDPSAPRDSVSGSIPQALGLMNSALVNNAITARYGALHRKLAEVSDDRQLITELYLEFLSRQPTEREVSVCLSYVRRVGDRTEAFEDIAWSLINSTEFRYRR